MAFSAVVFSPPIDWSVNTPEIDFVIPSTVQVSKLLNEQRATSFQEGENTRLYRVSYVSWGVDEVGLIQNDLHLVADNEGLALLPFYFEPMMVDSDLSATAFFTADPSLGGPSWYMLYQMLMPPISSPLPPAEVYNVASQYYVMRYNLDDPTQYEVRKITGYATTPGYIVFTLQNPWTLAISAAKAVYFFCDICRMLNLTKTSLADDKHQYDIEWESTQHTFGGPA